MWRRTQLHNVANRAHDDESGADSGAHVEELLLIGCIAKHVSSWFDDPASQACNRIRCAPGGKGTSRTLGALLGELDAVAGKLEGGLEEFLDLVGHVG